LSACDACVVKHELGPAGQRGWLAQNDSSRLSASWANVGLGHQREASQAEAERVCCRREFSFLHSLVF